MKGLGLVYSSRIDDNNSSNSNDDDDDDANDDDTDGCNSSCEGYIRTTASCSTW